MVRRFIGTGRADRSIDLDPAEAEKGNGSGALRARSRSNAFPTCCAAGGGKGFRSCTWVSRDAPLLRRARLHFSWIRCTLDRVGMRQQMGMHRSVALMHEGGKWNVHDSPAAWAKRRQLAGWGCHRFGFHGAHAINVSAWFPFFRYSACFSTSSKLPGYMMPANTTEGPALYLAHTRRKQDMHACVQLARRPETSPYLCLHTRTLAMDRKVSRRAGCICSPVPGSARKLRLLSCLTCSCARCAPRAIRDPPTLRVSAAHRRVCSR